MRVVWHRLYWDGNEIQMERIGNGHKPPKHLWFDPTEGVPQALGRGYESDDDYEFAGVEAHTDDWGSWDEVQAAAEGRIR